MNLIDDQALVRQVNDQRTKEKEQPMTTTTPLAITVHEPADVTVGPSPMQVAMAKYSDPQVVAVIRDQICPDATAPEMWTFLSRCVTLGLDPFSRQLYFIKRQGKVSHQIGIDGFRSIADRTGELVGISEPEYVGTVKYEGKDVPELARVTYIREINGKDRSFVGTARWVEFCPANPNDFMWKKMPHHMLGKCAEAQAARRAFPQKLGGLSTDAEAMSGEEIFGAQVRARGSSSASLAPQYLETVNAQTGEISQTRAGDEYARLYPEESEPVNHAPAVVEHPEPEDAEAMAKRRTAYETLRNQGKRYGMTVPPLPADASLDQIESTIDYYNGLVLEAKSIHDEGLAQGT